MSDVEAKPYAEFAKDSRQRKLLRKVLREHFLGDFPFSRAADIKETNPQRQLDGMWAGLNPQGQRKAQLLFLERDRKEAPPYREIGQRLRQIRQDRKISLNDFSKLLFCPKGELPYPGRELRFSPNRLRDMEYGILPFAASSLPEMILNKFGVSVEWLMRGSLRGAGTATLRDPVMARIDSQEERIESLENSTAEALGKNHLKILEDQKHVRVVNHKLVSGTNTQLRLELDEAWQKIKQLEKTLEVSSALVKNMTATDSKIDRMLEAVETWRRGV